MHDGVIRKYARSYTHNIYVDEKYEKPFCRWCCYGTREYERDMGNKTMEYVYAILLMKKYRKCEAEAEDEEKEKSIL